MSPTLSQFPVSPVSMLWVLLTWKCMKHVTSPYNILHIYKLLKGTVSQDFLLLVFFHESVSPQPQGIPLGPFQIFCENLRKYSQVKVHLHINDTGGKIAACINNTGGIWQICRRYQWHQRQILTPVLLVLLITVAQSTISAANSPPVSLTPVANNRNNIRLLRP